MPTHTASPDVPYRELGRAERLRAAADRWPLLRAVDQHLELARWRRASRDGAGDVVTLEPQQRDAAAEPWFLAAAPAPAQDKSAL